MAKVHVGAEEAVAQLAAGRAVVVLDDAGRKDEGDIVVAAELAGAETVNFMARHARGLVRLALAADRWEELALPLVPERGRSRFQTAFGMSIEARDGVTSGISARDRARTIQVAVDPRATPTDLVRPGHIVPLRARPGGVLERRGHTEAAVDLARLAGLRPAGVICQVLDAGGAVARGAGLEAFCVTHGLSLVTVADLVDHRRRTEPVVERAAATGLPTRHGTFDAVGYRELGTGDEHLALVMGDVEQAMGVLVHLHAQCFSGHVLRSAACGCGDQLSVAVRRIAAEGSGVLVHLGRPAGAQLLGQCRDPRDVRVATDILRDLGVLSVRLTTDLPETRAAVAAHGVPVVRACPAPAARPAVGPQRAAA